MSGNQTHGFDVVVEIAEDFFNRYLGSKLNANTSSGGPSQLCQALTTLNLGFLCGIRPFEVSMDRPDPTDIAIPPGETDTLDIRIDLGAGQLRLVVGLTVDRTDDHADIIFVDFQNRLFAARASIVGFPIPEALVKSTIANAFGMVQLPSVGLAEGRGSMNPLSIIRADTKIIDDRSAGDHDAWALMLTFGGGSAGNPNDFTESVIPTGGNSAILIFFNWLCRIISPKIVDALPALSGAFADCHLTSPVTMDAGENVTLTRLDLDIVDDFIQLSAAVSKSGFCYTATGMVTARLKLDVTNGHLTVQSQVDDPVIDISVPWYCWLVAIAVGVILAVVGGVLFGVIGAIVGAVIVPLIMWIASEVIDGIISKVTGTIGDALNHLEVNADITIPGLEFLLTGAHIDDVTIRAQLTIKEKAPVRHSGTLTVPDNHTVDLDKGIVGDIDASGADLRWSGNGFARGLETVCISSLSRTGGRDFDNVLLYDLAGFNYLSPMAVSLNELAAIDPVGWLFGGDKYRETLNVFGVRTNENRYSIIRVVRVEDGYIQLQYKTFENTVTSLDLTGGFTCENSVFGPKDAVAEFEPSAMLEKVEPAQAPAPVQIRGSNGVFNKALRMQNAVTQPSATLLPAATVRELLFTDLSPADRIIGHWNAGFTVDKKQVGHFTAVAAGLKAPVIFQWAINSDALEGAGGTVTVSGKRIVYTITGNKLMLKPIDRVKFQFELKVTAIDDRSEVLAKTKCITFDPICLVKQRHIPSYATYKETYMKHWGIVEEAPVAKVVQVGSVVK